MSNLRLTLTDDQGTLLDTVTLSRAEYDAARTSPGAALAVLSELEPGADPDTEPEPLPPMPHAAPILTTWTIPHHTD